MGRPCPLRSAAVTDLLSEPPSPLDAAIGLVAVELLDDARRAPPRPARARARRRRTAAVPPRRDARNLRRHGRVVRPRARRARERGSPSISAATSSGSPRPCHTASSAAASRRAARSPPPTSRSPPGTSPIGSSRSAGRATSAAPADRSAGKRPPAGSDYGHMAKRRESSWTSSERILVEDGRDRDRPRRARAARHSDLHRLVARFGAIAALVIIFGILMADRLPLRQEEAAPVRRRGR